MQDAAYRERLRSEADRWDAMAVTNRAFKLMRDWVDGPLAREYSLSSDWDDRWRTGGTVDEVMDEAHLGPDHIFEAIRRYAADREERHAPSARAGRRDRQQRLSPTCRSFARIRTSTSGRAGRVTCRGGPSRRRSAPIRRTCACFAYVGHRAGRGAGGSGHAVPDRLPAARRSTAA